MPIAASDVALASGLDAALTTFDDAASGSALTFVLLRDDAASESALTFALLRDNACALLF